MKFNKLSTSASVLNFDNNKNVRNFLNDDEESKDFLIMFECIVNELLLIHLTLKYFLIVSSAHSMRYI